MKLNIYKLWLKICSFAAVAVLCMALSPPLSPRRHHMLRAVAGQQGSSVATPLGYAFEFVGTGGGRWRLEEGNI